MSEEQEFDEYADNYNELHEDSTKLSGYETSYFDIMKIREIARVYSKKNDKINILNFGCGIGKSEKYLREFFPNAILYGTDISSKSVEKAIKNNQSIKNLHLKPYDGESFPFDVEFDLIFTANVFHHIPHIQHNNSFKLIYDSLAKGGEFFIFEHNPFNPLTLKAVKDCEFDEDAVLLYPRYTRKHFKKLNFKQISINYILFFPQFINFLNPIEKYLSFIPIGAQYYCRGSK